MSSAGSLEGLDPALAAAVLEGHGLRPLVVEALEEVADLDAEPA